jgi:hypothetical protein
MQFGRMYQAHCEADVVFHQGFQLGKQLLSKASCRLDRAGVVLAAELNTGRPLRAAVTPRRAGAVSSEPDRVSPSATPPPRRW